MRILCRIVSLCLCVSYAFACEAYSSYPHTYLVHNRIKPNPTVKSKPLSFTKLASIYFIGQGDDVVKNITSDSNCPSGTTWYGGRCEKNCDRTLYPFDDQPDSKKGVAQYILCLGNLLFGYKSCNDGWLLEGGNCTDNPCTGYNYTSYPDSSAGVIESCKSGDNMKYKYTSCNEGWDLSGTTCNIHNCSTTTYPYSSYPGSEAGTVITCKTGTATKYGYSSCKTGWSKSGGYCYANTCSGYTSTTSVISNCTTTASCMAGSTAMYKCTACNSGYEVSNGVCTATICPTGKVNLYVCPMWKCLVPAN